jgi:uncharacterized cupredoxin-like copper-binding protein
MRKMLVSALCAGASAFAVDGHLMAGGDLTAQTPVQVDVQLGDGSNARRFFPDRLELETGKLYKLRLHNASAEKHYFSSDGLSRAVFTRKAQVLGADGTTIAEVKGAVREIEVYPNGTAEWWFVPVKTGAFDDLKCTMPGHAEAGMVGTTAIE